VLTGWAAFSFAAGVGLVDLRREPRFYLPGLVLETDRGYHDRAQALLTLKRIAHQNRIVPVRARAQQRHRRLHQFLDPLDVFDRRRR